MGSPLKYIAVVPMAQKMPAPSCTVPPVKSALIWDIDGIITYTLQSESGASLKASGFRCEGSAGGIAWTGERQRAYYVSPAEMKNRWVKKAI